MCAGKLTVTCPDAQGLQPSNSSLHFVLQAWKPNSPKAAIPVDLTVSHDLPGMFQLCYNIPKVGKCEACPASFNYVQAWLGRQSAPGIYGEAELDLPEKHCFDQAMPQLGCQTGSLACSMLVA